MLSLHPISQALSGDPEATRLEPSPSCAPPGPQAASIELDLGEGVSQMGVLNAPTPLHPALLQKKKKNRV